MLVCITLAERKSELEAAEMVNFLLAFKCIVLQIKDQKKINGSGIFFSKKQNPKSTVFQYIACKKL